MLLYELKEVYKQSMEVIIYTYDERGKDVNLYKGNLEDLNIDGVLNKTVEGIYKLEGFDQEFEILVY